MNTQKFRMGDHVMIADDLGESMRHFTSGKEAIVIGSYDDQYGGGDKDDFTLHIKDKGRCSWYHGHQLTLLENNRADLLRVWKDEAANKEKEESDLDWIFSNGQQAIESSHSLQALADTLDLGSLWGSRGEGIDYMINSLKLSAIAHPFVMAGDKEGWLKFADELINKVKNKM